MKSLTTQLESRGIPHRQIGPCLLINGDCLEVSYIDVESVDAAVTDPPYGLGFMGKAWDHGVPGEAYWSEVLRVLKPGAHLLAFGGSRTHHRMACAIEDAGFEIRDTIMWIYGSGFPKSHDVSKAIDKAAGAEREVVSQRVEHDICRPTGGGDERLVSSRGNRETRIVSETAPATDAARTWDGWGTALKPAFEPIIVARKPFKGSVAANVLEHGTGALNIDGCRVGTEDVSSSSIRKPGTQRFAGANHRPHHELPASPTVHGSTCGRWPANVCHDGSDEVVQLFPEQSSGGAPPRRFSDKTRHTYGAYNGELCPDGIGPTAGSAARFFYCAKASKSDRGNGNANPTVKPTALMQWLCRLVTPPGGVILDGFMGSGSTGKAEIREGFRFIGIDNDTENGYFDDACDRVRDEWREKRSELPFEKPPTERQPALFEGAT